MRAFTPPSRRTLALLLAILVLMAVPAPALAARTPPPVDPPSFEGDGDGGARARAKWTYMLYMSADNNLEDEAILNLNQMEAVGSTDEVNMVLQLDRSPDYDETNGNWTGTRRYRVDADSDPDIINSQLLEDMGEVDMGNANNLRDFVVWAVTAYPADRYYLDIWGHGGGWRDGTCNDYTSGSVIDTDELGTALAQAEMVTNVTLDGLGFDQCLMAQLEVFYEIKQFADVLVGAETLIPADGYNYTRVMAPLVADPDMDAEQLADVIVTAFFDEYGHDNDRAHSAVDSEALDARLAASMTRMAQLLRANASSLRDEIKLARDLAQTYSTLDYIDLGNFTEHLLRTVPANETELRRAISEVRENVTAVVVAEDHGIGRSGSTGLSFYFPRYGMAWSYSNIQFGREGRWDEFLTAYFDRRDRPNDAPTVQVTAPLPGSVVGLVFDMDGTANDTDGNVTNVQVKFDRGPWDTHEAADVWSINVSTAGLDPGLHRVSVRSVDDDGDYSPEVQFTLNVLSTGLELFVGPDEERTYAGGSVGTTLVVSAFGDQGGHVSLEVLSPPSGLDVDLPFTTLEIDPRGSVNGTMTVTVDPGTPLSEHRVVVRAWMADAPLIQAFAVMTVKVTERWPDLVVTDVSIDPARPREGDVVTVNVTVTNTGLAAATSFDLEVRRYFDPGVNASMEVLLKEHVEVLPVGQFVRVAVEWTATIGTHEFMGVADPSGNVSDLETMDNTASRLLVLEGYSPMFEAFPKDTNVTPGEMVHFKLYIMNAGNLMDTLVLSHVNSTLGWQVRFNSTIFALDPRETHIGNAWVHVPEGVTGGTIEWVTLRLASTGNLSKYQDITLSLLYVEEFGMVLSQDKVEGTLGPLGTDSFNVTISNGGNGYENYTLEYIRQTDHLFVSAVMDRVEVAPGCATTVEVFYSTMDTDVGGQSFGFDLRVRSDDNASVVDVLSFQVRVRRTFGLTAEVQGPLEELAVLPGYALAMGVAVTSNSNYPMDLEVVMSSGLDAFFEPISSLGTIGPGEAQVFTVVLLARQEVPMGDVAVELAVHEANASANFTVVSAQVEIMRVDASSLRVDTMNETDLAPGANWRARLLLVNDGNHPETYTLNTSFVPGWLMVGLSQVTVDLPAYSEAYVEVTLWLTEDDFDAPGSVMLVVNANPANVTDGAPKVVLDVPVDVESSGDELSLWFVVVPLLALVVAVVVLMLVRQRRLTS